MISSWVCLFVQNYQMPTTSLSKNYKTNKKKFWFDLKLLFFRDCSFNLPLFCTVFFTLYPHFLNSVLLSYHIPLSSTFLSLPLSSLIFLLHGRYVSPTFLRSVFPLYISFIKSFQSSIQFRLPITPPPPPKWILFWPHPDTCQNCREV